MPSTIQPNDIDTTKPQTGSASTANVRGNEEATKTNFERAVADINALEASVTGKASQAALDAHVADQGNPHAVTAAQVNAEPAGSVSTHNADTGAHGMTAWSNAWLQLANSLAGRNTLESPRLTTSATDPVATSDVDAGYRIGDLWFNSASGFTWICHDNTAGAADWRYVNKVFEAYDVALSYQPGQVASIGNRFDFIRLLRPTRINQNLAGAQGILDATSHTQDAIFELYLNRAQWTPTTFRLAAVLTFPAGVADAVWSSIEPDIAAGQITLDINDTWYLHDHTSQPLADANILARIEIYGWVR